MAPEDLAKLLRVLEKKFPLIYRHIIATIIAILNDKT
jgi:hypothetical protein